MAAGQESNQGTRQSWWQRNWAWVIPAGCFGTIVVVALFVVAILFIVIGGFKSSGVYSGALELARSNDEVIEALGEPLETGWLPRGSIHITGPSGDADIEISLSGPRNTATLYVVAEKHAGRWHFELAEVEIHGQSNRIDLLAPE